MRPLLLAVAVAGAQGWAQEGVRAQASLPCTVRIRPLAAADYDPGSEVALHGEVTFAGEGLLKVRLACGVVRVEVGRSIAWDGSLVGQTVDVLAARRQDDQGQRFLARELRTAGGTWILRDRRGVPLP